jgi:hypothetical protein
MRIYDITRTLEPGMPTWPGEPGPELSQSSRCQQVTQPMSHLSGVHGNTRRRAEDFISGAAGVRRCLVCACRSRAHREDQAC